MGYQPDRSAWGPGTSPWARIIPHFHWITRRPDLDGVFGGLRDFVVLATKSPLLRNRHVYPSTINMTIFKTADPVSYSESYLYPRFIVSPHGKRQIVLRYYLAQEDKPDLQIVAPWPDAPGKIKLRVHCYVRGEPKTEAEWICEPLEGVEIIGRYFSD